MTTTLTTAQAQTLIALTMEAYTSHRDGITCLDAARALASIAERSGLDLDSRLDGLAEGQYPATARKIRALRRGVR